MENRKIILLFSDLEGTILNEKDGTYNDEDMYHFLEQIDKLQDITGARINIHLVSPIYLHEMQKIVDKIDRNINSYNRINKEHRDIGEIEGATAYPEEDMISNEFEGGKVLKLKKPINSKEFDTARYGKANYVKNWCDIYKESETKDLIMCIYCGNGQNDLAAINYINTQKNGFTVCPKNSRTLAKEKAFFVSEKEDLRGITEGILAISKEIEKRNLKENKDYEDSKEKQGEEK